MKRREFIAGLGGAAAFSVSWPLAAYAQQSAKKATIGFMGANTASAQSKSTAALVNRLRELGWVEGVNLAIEYRWAEGRSDRSVELINELVRLNVDVIVTHSTANVMAAKQTTSSIPIVFAAAADPVGNHLVSSLGRPGANVTGLSLQSPELAGKRLELLREVVPSLGLLGMMTPSVGNENSSIETAEVQAASRTLGLRTETADIHSVEDIPPVVASFGSRVGALYLQTNPFLNTHRVEIAIAALAARLPTIAGFREYAEAGGLMSYGPSFTDLFRRAGDYIDKILRGAKAAEIPVEQPTKFDLIINVRTAKALGLTVPPRLLFTADEVIE
jgi:putative ABC transport system substrate-binding protein